MRSTTDLQMIFLTRLSHELRAFKGCGWNIRFETVDIDGVYCPWSIVSAIGNNCSIEFVFWTKEQARGAAINTAKQIKDMLGVTA